MSHVTNVWMTAGFLSNGSTDGWWHGKAVCHKGCTWYLAQGYASTMHLLGELPGEVEGTSVAI